LYLHVVIYYIEPIIRVTDGHMVIENEPYSKTQYCLY